MNQVAGLLVGAFADIDRVVDGLDAELATRRIDGASSIAWTYGHAANQVDAWLNVRFQNRAPHPLLGSDHFRRGGGGEAADWDAIRLAVTEIRDSALGYMAGVNNSDYDTRIPYDGSFEQIRQAGLNLRHALLRISAHHYFHTGEIAAIRSRLGHDVGDFPGPLNETI